MREKIKLMILGGVLALGLQSAWQKTHSWTLVNPAKAAEKSCVTNVKLSASELVEWINQQYEEDYRVVASNSFYSLEKNAESYYVLMCIP